jgi:translocation and assembly module TamB
MGQGDAYFASAFFDCGGILMMSDLSNQDIKTKPATRYGRWLSIFFLIIVAISAGVIWLVSSTPGLRLLAATVTHNSAGIVSIEGVSGALLGTMSAKTLIVSRSDLRISVRDIRLGWHPAALLAGKLEITTLAAKDVEVLILPSPFPDNLRLPLSLSLNKLDIGTLRVISKEGGAADFSANNLSAQLESDGHLHHLQYMRATLEYGKLTASGQMDGTRPFALQARADIAGLSNLIAPGAKDAHISATVSGNMMQLAVNIRGSGAGLSGEGLAQLTPYAAFPLAALHLQVSGLNPRAFSPEAPKADLALQADLRGNTRGQLEGDVSAKNLSPATIDRGGLPLLNAHAHATFSADSLQFDNLALAIAGGASISGYFGWQRERATGSADLAVSRLDPSALDTRLRAAQLSGSMKISGDGAAQQGVFALGNGTVHLDAHLVRVGDTLTLKKLRLARGEAALSGQGKMGLSGQRTFTFKAKLHNFDLASFLRTPHSDLNATLELTGELVPQATGTVRFMMNDSHLADQPVSCTGRIEFAGMSKIKGEAELRLGENIMSAKGGFGTVADLLQLDIIAPALKQLGPGFGGSIIAHASLAGSLSQPDVTFAAEGHNFALPGDRHLSSLTAAASLHGEALTLAANAVNYRIKEKNIMQSMLLEVNGSRAYQELGAEALLDNGSKITLHANGGLTDPASSWKNIQWQGALTELSGAGMLPFKLLAAMPVTLGLDHVSLDAAEFAVAGGKVHIESAAWNSQQWNSRGSFTNIGLRAGIGLKPILIERDANEVLRLGGEWDIASAEQLIGNLRVARESGDWVLPGDPPIPLGLRTLQFTARAADGRLAGELSALGDILGDWHANIAMPVAKSGAGWTVPARAPIIGQMRVNVSDLAWIGVATNDNMKIGGRLSMEADVAGTFDAPRLRGQVRGDELELAFLDQGVRLQQGQLAARFDEESLHIETLSFIAPHEPQPRDSLLSGLNLAREPGKLSVSGTINLSNENGNLEISAIRLPLAQRADRWIIASGSGHAKLNKNNFTLNGNIIADAGLIGQTVTGRPQLSDDIVVTGRQEDIRKMPSLSVDATLDLGNHFYLRTSGLEARLAGKLSVRDVSGQQLHVTGTITASDASFEAYGQRLTVERGIVNFQGPLYDPGINILALRKGLSVEAGVEVTGTALRPVGRLVSTPLVPDSEKLSWIVLGRPPDASGTDSSMLLAAAGSILGGRSGGISAQLKQKLGVDELSLRQIDNSSQQTSQIANDNSLSSQIVTIGKRLSSRAYLSYEQGVSAVAGVTKLTYTLTPRVNIVTQAGIDNAIDVFYIFNFE